MAASSDTPSRASLADLDLILAIQITVAWAGEQIAGPIVQETGSSAPQASRLGWWRTELTDPDAGGDFLKRLLPRTHAWAALGAVREAARRVDEKARRRHATPDALWSLFHFGFAWDERLDARLAEHRRGDAPPGAVLSVALPLAGGFERPAFVAWARALSGDTASDVVPGGRRLRGRPVSRTDGARRLAAVLAPPRAEPLPAEYPLPFFPMGLPRLLPRPRTLQVGSEQPSRPTNSALHRVVVGAPAA